MQIVEDRRDHTCSLYSLRSASREATSLLILPLVQDLSKLVNEVKMEFTDRYVSLVVVACDRLARISNEW